MPAARLGFRVIEPVHVGLLADVPEAPIRRLQRVHWHQDGQLLRSHDLVPVGFGGFDCHCSCYLFITTTSSSSYRCRLLMLLLRFN